MPTVLYCTADSPIKDESIPKGSTDTQHDVTNIILHPPHTVGKPHAYSPTVSRGHSQEMTSVKAVHTLHTRLKDIGAQSSQ